MPGAVLGVAALRSLDATALQVAVSVGVLATLAARRLRPERRAHERWWAAPVTGFTAGGLVTSTNTSGPPLLVYMLGRGDEPERFRDTLTVCQLGLSVIGVLALVVTGTSGAVPRAWLVAVFVPAGGARAHRRAAAVPAPGGERRVRAGAHRDPRRGRRDGPGDSAHLSQ